MFWPWGTRDLSFLTRGQIHTHCIGRRPLNHWTTREVSLSFFLDYLFIYFYSSFRFTAKLNGKCKWLLYIPAPTNTCSPPLTSFSTVVHLLQSMNLCWHFINTWSPQLASGFTLSVVYSMGFDTHIMTCLITFWFCFWTISHICSGREGSFANWWSPMGTESSFKKWCYQFTEEGWDSVGADFRLLGLMVLFIKQVLTY